MEASVKNVKNLQSEKRELQAEHSRLSALMSEASEASEKGAAVHAVELNDALSNLRNKLSAKHSSAMKAQATAAKRQQQEHLQTLQAEHISSIREIEARHTLEMAKLTNSSRSAVHEVQRLYDTACEQTKNLRNQLLQGRKEKRTDHQETKDGRKSELHNSGSGSGSTERSGNMASSVSDSTKGSTVLEPQLSSWEELASEQARIDDLEVLRQNQLYEINQVQKNLDAMLTMGGGDAEGDSKSSTKKHAKKKRRNKHVSKSATRHDRRWNQPAASTLNTRAESSSVAATRRSKNAAGIIDYGATKRTLFSGGRANTLEEEKWLDMGMAPVPPPKIGYMPMTGAIESEELGPAFGNDPRSTYTRSPSATVYHTSVADMVGHRTSVEMDVEVGAVVDEVEDEEEDEEEDAEGNAENSTHKRAERSVKNITVNNGPSVTSLSPTTTSQQPSSRKKKRKKHRGVRKSPRGSTNVVMSAVERMEHARRKRIRSREERRKGDDFKTTRSEKSVNSSTSKRRKANSKSSKIEQLHREEMVRVRKETSDMNRKTASAVTRKIKRLKKRPKKKTSFSQSNNSSISSTNSSTSTSTSTSTSSSNNNRRTNTHDATSRVSSAVRQRWTSMKVNLKTSSKRNAIELNLKKLRSERIRAERRAVQDYNTQ